MCMRAMIWKRSVVLLALLALLLVTRAESSVLERRLRTHQDLLFDETNLFETLRSETSSSFRPTRQPSSAPTQKPRTMAPRPTGVPTASPTGTPRTMVPRTERPTTNPPTQTPRTMKPRTDAPTFRPTLSPTRAPTSAPSRSPPRTMRPRTAAPTFAPSKVLTETPTVAPTKVPTTMRPRTDIPTSMPTSAPSRAPRTMRPSTDIPTSVPTVSPSLPPRTMRPRTDQPTSVPTSQPSPGIMFTSFPRPRTSVPTLAFPSTTAECACQPATYRFKINLDLSCDNTTVGGPGVKDVSCTESGPQDPQAQSVVSVDILELDANGEVLAELSLSAEFQDGDTFVYDTLVGQNKYDPDKLPQGLKMNMIAKDGDDKEIVQSWSISFQSTCNSFPVLQRLQSIGWVVMQKLGDPTADVCPLAAAGPAPSPTPRPVRRTVAPTPQSMLSIGPTPSPAAGRMTRKPQGSPTVEPITETGSSGTLLDVLQADSEMSTFLSLASAVQVDDEFLYGGPYTIFVAPDSAYDELGSDYVRLLASHSSFVLHTYSILLNHVTDGTIARNDLVDGSTISLFSGETVNVKERTGGKTFLQTFAASAQMTDPIQVDGTEIDASNGVVYKVGDVLLPIWYYLDALSMLSYQPDVFSTLSQWIVAAGVESEVRSPYVTLLTPVNTAFDGISKEMSEHLLSAEGADDLKAILLYHILPVVVAFPSIPAGSSTIKTVQGESVVIDLKTSNSGQVEIKFNGADTTSYFLTKQSILYAIDSLLIPPSLSAPASTTGPTLSPTFAPPLDTTLYELMETVEDVSVFLLLLEGMGADTILSDSSRGPFTIFAPSNDALERTIGSEYMAKLLELDYDLHLRSLALYHIAPVELRDFQLKDQLLIIMSNQLAVRVERNDNTTSLVTSSIRMGRTAPVTVFDGSAVTENGVFFATDEPILPFWYFFTPVQGLSLAPQSSKFLELVELANLREWLDSLVDVTLVVPNNDAFDMLPAETMDFLRESNNLETLQQVLQYHVMPTVIPFTSLDTDKHNFVTFLDSSVVTFSVALGDEAGQQLRINHAAVVGEGYFLVQHGLVYELASLLIPSWLDLPKSDVIEQLALTIEPIDLLSRSQLVLEEERISNIPYHPPV